MGVMDRLVLTDAAWERMAPLIIGRPDLLWIVRTGSPWRDLPEAFGDWNSVFRRFSRASKGGWRRIFFKAMANDPDVEYLIVDSATADRLRHVIAAKGALAVIPNNPHHKTSRLRKS